MATCVVRSSVLADAGSRYACPSRFWSIVRSHQSNSVRTTHYTRPSGESVRCRALAGNARRRGLSGALPLIPLGHPPQRRSVDTRHFLDEILGKAVFVQEFGSADAFLVDVVIPFPGVVSHQ